MASSSDSLSTRPDFKSVNFCISLSLRPPLLTYSTKRSSSKEQRISLIKSQLRFILIYSFKRRYSIIYLFFYNITFMLSKSFRPFWVFS
nr:MAG TPA: hypothetical protein [Caudoviricetes sp.]